MNRDNSMLIDYSLVPAKDPQKTYNYNEMDWADPSIEHAVACLKQAAQQEGLRRALGRQAAEDIAARFGLDAWAGVPHLQRLAACGRPHEC
jgi:hypothetical protein